jgi:alpha-tubulin suppressor-like RCC1 family protein
MCGNTNDGRIPHILPMQYREKQNNKYNRPKRRNLNILSPYAIDSELLLNYTIVKIACSSDHTVYLTNTGRVLVSGNGSCGKMGIGNEDDIFEPVMVTNLEHEEIVDVECGNCYTFFLTKDGRVLSAGGNWVGQCGLSEVSLAEKIPTLVCIISDEVPVIKKIACGVYHTLLVSVDGSLYGCGVNKYGQLGFENDIKSEDEYPMFLKLPLPFDAQRDAIIDIKCGTDYTLILTESGMLYAGGSYKMIFEYRTSQFEKVEIGNLRVAHIHAGFDYFMFITKFTDDVYVCGLNSSGQFGMQASERPISLQISPNLSQKQIVSLYGFYEQTLALTQSGLIWVAGANSYGQLGINSNQPHIFPPQMFNLTPDMISLINRGMKLNIACGQEHTVFYFTAEEASNIPHFRLNLKIRQQTNQFTDITIDFDRHIYYGSKNYEPPRKKQKIC